MKKGGISMGYHFTYVAQRFLTDREDSFKKKRREEKLAKLVRK